MLPYWPTGDHLLFVAWEHQASNFPALSQRLGIVFCFNRPCALYAVPWPQQAQQGATAAGANGGSNGQAAAGEAGAANGAEAAAAAPAPTRAVCLTPSVLSAFSPRFGPPSAPAGQQQLVFLSQAAAVASGVHAGTSSLHSLSWQVGRGPGEVAGSETARRFGRSQRHAQEALPPAWVFLLSYPSPSAPVLLGFC